MAKDKTKTIVYSARVLVNGEGFTFRFRKEKQRTEFMNRAQYLTGVTQPEAMPVIYVYETADDALNTLANYADRVATV